MSTVMVWLPYPGVTQNLSNLVLMSVYIRSNGELGQKSARREKTKGKNKKNMNDNELCFEESE